MIVPIFEISMLGTLSNQTNQWNKTAREQDHMKINEEYYFQLEHDE